LGCEKRTLHEREVDGVGGSLGGDTRGRGRVTSCNGKSCSKRVKRAFWAGGEWEGGINKRGGKLAKFKRVSRSGIIEIPSPGKRDIGSGRKMKD